MRAGEAIAELRRCRQLPEDLRLESDCDDRVERVVRGLMSAGADEVTRFRREAQAEELGLLMHWVHRASSLVVRRRDPDLLVAAVFGFAFAGAAGAEDWIHLQSQLRHAARIIGRDAGEAWSAAMTRCDAEGAAWLDANRGRRRFLRSRLPVGHYSDPYDGGRFRFGRPAPASGRIPLRDQPPGEPARPDLYGVAALREVPAIRAQLEALVADLWRAGRRSDADRLLHAVLAHDSTADALNELHAALAELDDIRTAGPLLDSLGAR